MVAVHDTIREVTTITVDRKENGDTVKTSIVTDRERVRDRAAVKDKKEKIIVRHDTVFVAVRDSVMVESHTESTESTESWPSALARALKWVFWIIIAIGALIVGWKVSKVFKFFI